MFLKKVLKTSDLALFIEEGSKANQRAMIAQVQCGIRTQMYWLDLLASHRNPLQTNLREKIFAVRTGAWFLNFLTRNVSLHPLASLMVHFQSNSWQR